ncbi:MAG: hypothetical protein OIN89_07865 [Candidatus Methanoperedens sp.]|nr:hypothetical protein [Candidatus Methanoperedens sp.]
MALRICVFLILLLPAAGAKSIIIIDIQENGNALWSIEQRLPFTGGTEINDWEKFIQKVQDSAQYRDDLLNFSYRIKYFLGSAEKDTNRSMNAINFNISYDIAKTLSGDFGIIRYSYEWQNFSRIDAGKIIIGDTFSEGMLLSADTVLIIKIPEGYEVLSTSPGFDKRDGNRLIWDGTMYRSFSKGEPEVVLSRNSLSGTLLAIIVLTGLFVASSMFFWKKGYLSHIDVKNVFLTPNPSMEIEDLQYEEMIEHILIKSGGQAFQSDIVKETMLSKSKISIVISEMKHKGRIIKIRKGKENLIRLVNK